MVLHLPLPTYFHSALPLVPLDWPAQLWVPARLAQSFFAGSGNAVTFFFFLGVMKITIE